MASLIKLEIVSREIIKPYHPTPKIQQNFILSAIDQLVIKVYIPLISFYFLDVSKQPVHRQVLKISLSKVLTRFYPFAGRIKDDNLIECNDDGVEYVEAQVNVKLSDLVRDPNIEKLKMLVPVEVDSPQVTSNDLLQVQVSFFECGGIAIGVCLSHTIGDATTLATFIKAWSNEASGHGDVIVPRYTASLLFPPINNLPPSMTIVIPRRENFVRNRYVFSSSSITKLRSIASSLSVPHPTRVEAVTALIWKCLIRFSSPPYFCTHVLNLRKKITPPLEEHTIGNIVGVAEAKVDVKDIEMHDLVCQLREKIQAYKDFDRNKVIEKLLSVYGEKRGDVSIINFSGLCKLPFYETDFGWGKPAWVAYVSPMFPNLFTMIDTKDGDGIEVWGVLPKDDANFLQRDQEFLSFASVNPSVLST